ncbi:hypothetical protein V6Z12_A03G159000 [Gossypium hirsutum]
MAKFLQAQSKIMVMAVIAGVVLVLHTVLSWLLMLKLGWGLAGAAVVLNMSWIFIVVAQFLYIISGACDRTWTGFSWKAFQHLWGFVRLSLASAVMLCMNILGWTIMVAMGMNAAISVRVSNELGAGHPRTAKFSLLVAVSYSFMIGITIALILIIFRNHYPYLFSNDSQVQEMVIDLTPLLALCITINNVQPVLSGMAVGAGWQTAVAYVNITCYYLFGVPLGLTLGFLLHMGVKGIWCGMLTGTVVQTCVLLGMIYKTNWNKEASMAGERIKKWGGDVDTKETNMLKNSNN